jgi:hypothetical protein
MFCPQCGKQTFETSNFCVFCGSPRAPEIGPPGPSRQPKSRKWLALALGLIILMFIYALNSGPSRDPVQFSQNGADDKNDTAASKDSNEPAVDNRYAHFNNGTHIVGRDIQAGTYRTRSASSGCYYARLSGFSGSLDQILSNENTDSPAVVTIESTDKGFNSARCATWTQDLSAITTSRVAFSDGIYIVGTDITPGTYRSIGQTGCYFARLRGFSGAMDDVLANENSDGPAAVTIEKTDEGFMSHRCGSWTTALEQPNLTPRYLSGDVTIDLPKAENDFGTPKILKTLYGNYDSESQTALWENVTVPNRRDLSNFPNVSRGMTSVVFDAAYRESGIDKQFVITSTKPTGQSYDCHVCLPLLGAAVFSKRGNQWFVESEEKYLILGAPFGRRPKCLLARIGPQKYGVVLEYTDMAQGFETEWIVLLTAKEKTIKPAITLTTRQYPNDALCSHAKESDESCIHYSVDYQFIVGSNPVYFDILTTKKVGTGENGKNASSKTFSFAGDKYVPLAATP